GGDVEWHAEEDVGAALVELAGESALRHVELEQGVAGRERHSIELGDIPGGDDQPARVRVAPNGVDHAGDLVDAGAVTRGPGTPLRAVDRPQLATLVGPLVPDAD